MAYFGQEILHRRYLWGVLFALMTWKHSYFVWRFDDSTYIIIDLVFILTFYAEKKGRIHSWQCVAVPAGSTAIISTGRQLPLPWWDSSVCRFCDSVNHAILALRNRCPIKGTWRCGWLEASILQWLGYRYSSICESVFFLSILFWRQLHRRSNFCSENRTCTTIGRQIWPDSFLFSGNPIEFGAQQCKQF